MSHTPGTIPSQLLADLDYTEWASRVLLDSSAGLSTEELERPLGLSHGSVLGTLHHIFLSEQYWDQCLRTGLLPPSNPAREPDPALPSLAELTRAWRELTLRWRAWVQAQPGEAFAEPLSASGSDPIARISRYQVIRHAVNHATLHRGQVVSMLRMLGKEPPSVDLMTYYLIPKTADGGRPGEAGPR